MSRVGRGARAQFDDTGVFIVEAFDPNPLLQASGNDCVISGLVTSPRLLARAAAMVCTTFGHRAFDRQTLEGVHSTLSQLVGLVAGQPSERAHCHGGLAAP